MKTHILRILLAIFILALCCNPAAGKKPKASQPWFFIQMSDPQMGFFDSNASMTEDIKRMEQAVGIVNRLKPDFVVVTGDLVNSPKNEAQLAEIKRLLALIDPSIPVWLLPGNHDITNSEASRQAYIKNYGYERFDFRHKNASVTGINSVLIKNEANGEAEQLEWLGNILTQRQKESFRFVFMHHSLFVKDPAEADNYSNIPGPMRTKYTELLKAQHVDAVFSGHTHHNHTARDGELQVITCGPVGKPLGKGFSGMNLVKVWPDRFESTFIALDEFPASVEF